jgi:hypothetical protein
MRRGVVAQDTAAAHANDLLLLGQGVQVIADRALRDAERLGDHRHPQRRVASHKAQQALSSIECRQRYATPQILSTIDDRRYLHPRSSQRDNELPPSCHIPLRLATLTCAMGALSGCEKSYDTS